MKTARHTPPHLLIAVLGLAGLGLFGPDALAQDQAPPAAPAAAPADAPAADQAPPPAAPPADAPALDAPPPPPEAPPGEGAPATVEDRLQKLENQLEGMNEPFSAMQTDVLSMKKLKFSGYIQGRYQHAEDSKFGVDPAGAALNKNRFFVRRARLKTTYRSGPAEFVLQFDAIPEGVEVRDAEASLVLDNDVIAAANPYQIKLTVGQFKVPFGFEVLQSSGVREAPERTRVARALFPGERDRGLRLQAQTGIVRFQTALINGNSIQDPIYKANDQTDWKDIVGRLGIDLEYLVLGVSGQYGRSLKTTLGKVGPPIVQPTYLRFRRVRLGADAQAFYDVPGLGGLTLRGEVIMAMDKNLSHAGKAADECQDVNGLGWYATLVQNFGDYAGAFVRYDKWDPNTGLADACNPMRKMDVSIDELSGITFGAMGYWTSNLKLTVAYEKIIEDEAKKADNDIFTVQLQSSF